MVKGLSTPKHEMALSQPKVILDERYQIAYSVGVLLGKVQFTYFIMYHFRADLRNVSKLLRMEMISPWKS